MPNVTVRIDNNRAFLALEEPFFVHRCHTSIHYGSHACERCPQKSLLWHHSHPQGLLTWRGLWVATWPAIHETQRVIFGEIKEKKCEFGRWNRCGTVEAWRGLRNFKSSETKYKVGGKSAKERMLHYIFHIKNFLLPQEWTRIFSILRNYHTIILKNWMLPRIILSITKFYLYNP